MGMSASSTGGRTGFPPFPDSAAGAFAFNRALTGAFSPRFRLTGPCCGLLVRAANQRNREVLACETQGFGQHFLPLPRHFCLAR